MPLERVVLAVQSANMQDAAVVGDFATTKLSVDSVSAAVLEQYDGDAQRLFYKVAMGGGSLDIHYGIFRRDTDGVREASAASTEFMMTCMDWARPVSATSTVLDLGSGHGGSTHAMVERFGCRVNCFNLCPEQNQLNAERCAELGISGRVDITLGDFNKPWPAEWADAFDYIWSAEALCHAGDKTQLFGQLTRCLRKGGIVVFSDIMGSDTAEEEQLRAFTSRNATTALGRPSEYEALLKAAGLTRVAWWDNSQHLERYFRSMLSQIEAHQEQLVSQGVSQAYLDKWRASLTERADTQAAHHVFTWGVFVARKD